MSVFGPTPIPGVPSLLQPLNLQGAALAVANVTGIGLPAQRIWAIYSQTAGGATNGPALNPDSIVSIDYKVEARVTNAPMEQGAFQSYNKVQEPSQVTLLLTKGGSDADRSNFLSQVIALQKKLDLLTIISPEVTYSNMNLDRYNYRRTATEGFTLLQIEAHFVKVRITAQTAYSNTAAPSGMATQVTSPICQAPNAIEQVSTISGIQEMPQTAKAFGLNYPGT